MLLLIISSLNDVLPFFCLKSCRLGVHRKLSGLAGCHGNHAVFNVM